MWPRSMQANQIHLTFTNLKRPSVGHVWSLTGTLGLHAHWSNAVINLAMPSSTDLSRESTGSQNQRKTTE
jgi:hypothetical protein